MKIGGFHKFCVKGAEKNGGWRLWAYNNIGSCERLMIFRELVRDDLAIMAGGGSWNQVVGIARRLVQAQTVCCARILIESRICNNVRCPEMAEGRKNNETPQE